MSRSRKAGRSLSALFALTVGVWSCDESTAPRGPGSISVSSQVQSQDAFFEYGISIDNGTPRRAFVGQTLLFTENGLAHGEHTISVVDVPSACTGKGSRTVTLQGDDTASVIFNIACPRTTGDLRFNVTTTGVDIDQDGYELTIDGGPGPILMPNSSVTFNNVPPDSYTFGLTDVASNCTTPAAQTVTVSVGELTTVNFNITCAAVGVLRFMTSISGEDRDPDGLLVSVDNVTTAIAASGTANVRVPVGTRTYQLSDQQPNCTLTGPATGTHTFAGGDTVTVTLSASCTAIPMGTMVSSVSEAAGDTFPKPTNSPFASHDITTITSRHTPGFFILVIRFGKSIVAGGPDNPAGLWGYVEIDLDENAATGYPAFVDQDEFGGSTAQGVDFGLIFHSIDSVSMIVANLPTPPSPATLAGRVRSRFESDSLTLFLPLNKLGDDRKFTLSTGLGPADRVSDIGPNSGSVAVQLPASIVAVRSSSATVPRPSGQRDGGEKIEYRKAGSWGRTP
jgi:hypothetical protein